MNRSFSKISKSVGVADDDRQFAVALGQGKDGVFAGDGLRHEFDDRRRDDHLGQIDVVQAVLPRHRPHHVLARRVAQSRQGVGELHVGLGGHLLGFGQSGRG